MFVEWCSNCGTEQELDESLGLIAHICPTCGVRLLPCRLCIDMHTAYGEVWGGLDTPNCEKCPFPEEEYDES